MGMPQEQIQQGIEVVKATNYWVVPIVVAIIGGLATVIAAVFTFKGKKKRRYPGETDKDDR